MLKTSPLDQTDYLLWLETNLAHLRAANYSLVDWTHLIEEIEDLGRAKKSELRSRLNTLLEHLLKRLYVDLPQEFNGWERTIRQQRKQLTWLLEDSLSLKTHWEHTWRIAWQWALQDLQQEYPDTTFPDRWLFGSDPDTLLQADFYHRQLD
ncbi:MAG: DUF29 domain-containing protein [Pseudanabaenaceae cyanobacterium bins.68]|nr:DUF29 domain-containing protein [Pseudanabaenaceae cyanobacterium bins.68]